VDPVSKLATDQKGRLELVSGYFTQMEDTTEKKSANQKEIKAKNRSELR
jgi:hypothetical protein